MAGRSVHRPSREAARYGECRTMATWRWVLYLAIAMVRRVSNSKAITVFSS